MDLFEPAVVIWGQPVTWIEVVGDVTALLSVWWAARQVIWTWPISLLSAACLATLFWHIDLAGNAGLQGVFFALGCWGWWEWGRRDRRPDRAAARPVRRTTAKEWAGLAAGFGLLWFGARWFLVEVAVSAEPVWDSLTVALSLVATYGQAKKLVESWWIWIAVDIVSVPLFWSQGAKLTSVLFGVFGVLCVLGQREWKRSLVAAEATVAATAADTGVPV